MDNIIKNKNGATNAEDGKKNTYRKSPWRILFALSAVLGGAELVGSLIAWLLYLATSDPYFAVGEAASVGIIGGADGPTAIFVTGPNWSSYILPVIMLVVGILGFHRLSRCEQK